MLTSKISGPSRVSVRLEIGHTPKVLDGNSDNWWEDRVRKEGRVRERGGVQNLQILEQH